MKTPQIASLEASARDVLNLIPFLRNMLQPVNRLPPMVLSHIAKHVLWADKYPDEDARQIIPLTHVCRYWRASIVSAPENWALISCRNKSLAELSLERSKASPLEVLLELDVFWKQPRFSDLLIPHLENIETLHILGLTTVGEITRALPNFPRSTPILRSLDVISWGNIQANPSIDPFQPFPHTLTDLTLLNIPLFPSFLGIRTLVQFEYTSHTIWFPLGAILTILEENPALESVTLGDYYREFQPPFQYPQRPALIRDRLRHLQIRCGDSVLSAQTLLSRISLGRGAHLEISSSERGLNEILSGIPSKHFANLLSPDFMQYRSRQREIRLRGPNGTFSFETDSLQDLFVEFPVLPSLVNIREFHFIHYAPRQFRHTDYPSSFLPPGPELLHPLASFPTLETFAIECDIQHNSDVSDAFSPLMSNPSAYPSLKTLAFFNCVITDEFMEGLTRFASRRKETASAGLHRVVIVHGLGMFPNVASIKALERNVPVVDVRYGYELPTNLT